MAETKSLGPMNNAQKCVDQLYDDLEGKWYRPASIAAWAFLVTEVAEIGDVLLRQGHFGIFARNHEKPSDRMAMVAELGDAFLMLCALANTLDVNLSAALDDQLWSLRAKYALNEEE